MEQLKKLRFCGVRCILFIIIALFTGVCCTGNNVVQAAVVLENSQPTSRSDGAITFPVPLVGSLQNPAWSPDGDELLFTRFINGYNIEPADLFVFNLATGNIRTLVSDGSGNINLPGSAWNRVTGYLAFSSSRGDHDEVYAISSDSQVGNEWQITNRADRISYEPSFSPDGEWVVFESHPLDREDMGVITAYKTDGSQAYQDLTPAGDDCRQPNWSPAGNLILSQKFANGQWDLWTMKPDGSSHQQITSGPGDKTDASFSPDGKWIVYSAAEGGLNYANLFIISATGGVPARLTAYNGYDGAPSWSPDGHWIAFESAPQDPDAGSGTSIWQIPVPLIFASSAPTLAAPDHAQQALLYSGVPLNPKDTPVSIVAWQVLLHPTLIVPAEDVGQQGTLIVYIYLPGYGVGFTSNGPAVVLEHEEVFSQVFPDPIDLSAQSGQVFDLYYGYCLADGSVKYNAYEILLRQPESLHTRLDNAQTWMYQIQGLDEDGAIEALEMSDYPMLVLEPGHNFLDGVYDTVDMLSRLRHLPNGDERLLIAYLDIGQAEDYRNYWQPGWIAPTAAKPGIPDFLVTIDPDGWSGNYPVAYWDQRWQTLWLGEDGIVAKLARMGFDGIYLDWVEAYDDETIIARAERDNKNAAMEMIRFVAALGAAGRAVRSDFLVIVQNAPYLINADVRQYSLAIDALAVEDTWFHGAGDAQWNDPQAGDLRERHDGEWSTASRLSQYQKYLDQGIPVFSVDYCISADNARRVYQDARQAGLRPLVTRVSLSQLTETPPPY